MMLPHHGTHGMDHTVCESLKRDLQQKQCSLLKIALNGQDDLGKMMLVQRIISPFAFLVLPAWERQMSHFGLGVCFVLV